MAEPGHSHSAFLDEEILSQLPRTFQMFVALWKEAENTPQIAVELHSSPDFAEKETLSQTDHETLRSVLGELEIAILREVKNNGSNSKLLAEKLGVSVETVKRRYKVLLHHGLIKATRKRGVTATLKGLEFIAMNEQNVEKVSIDTKHADTNDTIVAIDA